MVYKNLDKLKKTGEVFHAFQLFSSFAHPCPLSDVYVFFLVLMYKLLCFSLFLGN